jgi:hypothetical protein
MNYISLEGEIFQKTKEKVLKLACREKELPYS